MKTNNEIVNGIMHCPDPIGAVHLVPIYKKVVKFIDDENYDVIDEAFAILPMNKVGIQWGIGLLRLTLKTADKYPHRKEFIENVIERAWETPTCNTHAQIERVFAGLI